MTTRQNIQRWSRPYASVYLTGGPSRVRDETPPEDWEPKPFVGFTSNAPKEENDD